MRPTRVLLVGQTLFLAAGLLCLSASHPNTPTFRSMMAFTIIFLSGAVIFGITILILWLSKRR
jgi:hypothetical protein